MVDQAEIHRMARSEDVEEHKRAVENLENNFVILEDKKQAWEDLHRLTSDTDSGVRWRATYVLGMVFSLVPERIQAWDDLHRLTLDTDSDVRRSATSALGRMFSLVPDKKQALDDLYRLTSDTDNYVRQRAAETVGIAFSHVQDKKQAWDGLHRLTSDMFTFVRQEAAKTVGIVFFHVPDKTQAWDDLHRLTSDYDSDVRFVAAEALGRAFSFVPDKKQAWYDLIRLASNDKWDARRVAANALGSAFSHVPDKKQAWDDLIRLAYDNESPVCGSAASALGNAFSHLTDKEQAWDDLIRLTSYYNWDVRVSAYYSLGKASIFKAASAENDIDFKKEMEAAIGYFEKSSPTTWTGPAKFCLPFYRSFYTLTFKKEEAEAEVQKYIAEAKSAIEGSESKEKLLEAVENLGNALKEVQNLREKDFDAVKCDLNAYRRYCERAADMLDAAEDKAPGAARLVRRGLPIIDERIEGILAEIEGKTKTLCKQVKDTEYSKIGQQANEIGQRLSRIRDPIGLEKGISNLLIPLSAICKKMPDENKGEACEILKKINEEQYIEDKLPLISMFLTKISTQMSKGPIIGIIQIESSEGVQVIVGNGNKQVQNSNSSHK